MKISVIVPVYNTEAYLPACLSSLLAQTEADFEILAVENGCTDSSARILAKYAERDPRIRVIHRPHGEVYEARNSGLAAASGEYIAFCDSDDTVPAGAYSCLLALAERSGCDVAIGGHTAKDDSGLSIREGEKLTRQSGFHQLLNPPCVWNKLIRRSFLERNSITFPPLVMGEDVLFLAKIAKCQPCIARTRASVYDYWNHNASEQHSMTHRYSLAFFRLHLQCRNALLEEMRGTPQQREAEDYVLGMLPFLRVFLLRIWQTAEREAAYGLFREHVHQLDWTGREVRAEALLGMPLEQFSALSAEDFTVYLLTESPRNAVLKEYRSGSIGFRYILKFMKEWALYKLRRHMK